MNNNVGRVVSAVFLGAALITVTAPAFAAPGPVAAELATQPPTVPSTPSVTPSVTPTSAPSTPAETPAPAPAPVPKPQPQVKVKPQGGVETGGGATAQR